MTIPVAVLLLALKAVQLSRWRDLRNASKRLWGLLLLSSANLVALSVDQRGAHRYSNAWYCPMLLQGHQVVVFQTVLINAIDQVCHVETNTTNTTHTHTHHTAIQIHNNNNNNNNNNNK